MRVAHVTIEDICSGLFRTQVIDISMEIIATQPDMSIDIIAINRPWKYLHHRVQLKKFKLILEGSGIQITYLPLLPPLRHVLKSAIYSKAIIKLLSILIKYFQPKNFDIYHCRSYLPTAAVLANGTKGVVFDARSLWVLENISAGNLVENSSAHRFWLKAEEFCEEKSDVVTIVSPQMGDYFRSRASCKAIKLIPISYQAHIFHYSMLERARLRAKLGWEYNTIFVYSGSFGLSGINTEALKRMFSRALSIPNARILFLSSESETSISELMAAINSPIIAYRVIHPQHEDMGKWLSAADIGLHSLPKQLDSGTRLGTKVVEYWACGLPVIVNEYVGAAAQMINDNPIGFVTSEGTSEEEFCAMVNSAATLDRQEISDCASKTFSAPVIGKLYCDAYSSARHP